MWNGWNGYLSCGRILNDDNSGGTEKLIKIFWWGVINLNIEFRVTNQLMKRVDKNIVVNKSQKYLKLTFNFLTEDWIDYTKYVIVSSESGENYNFPVVEDMVVVPLEVLKEGKYFTVALYGVNDESNSRITTTPRRVELVESGYVTDFTPIGEEDANDIFQEYRDKIKCLKEEFDSALDTKEDKFDFVARWDLVLENMIGLEF